MLGAERSTEGGRSWPCRFCEARATDGPCPPYGIIVQLCNARRGGTIFGCGNQQLIPHVIQTVGRDNIIVIAALDRLHALDGPPRVDTGDRECDRFLAGSVRAITGEGERAIWQVAP